jgi:hypothetical protein
MFSERSKLIDNFSLKSRKPGAKAAGYMLWPLRDRKARMKVQQRNVVTVRLQPTFLK